VAEKEPKDLAGAEEETEVIYALPEEVQEELDGGNEIVVFCWACYQVLYASEPRNRLTEEVAEVTIDSHTYSFSEFHDVRIFPDATPEKIMH
jgi:hypothetical protein